MLQMADMEEVEGAMRQHDLFAAASAQQFQFSTQAGERQDFRPWWLYAEQRFQGSNAKPPGRNNSDPADQSLTIQYQTRIESIGYRPSWLVRALSAQRAHRPAAHVALCWRASSGSPIGRHDAYARR
jgi:hypothetical protein